MNCISDASDLIHYNARINLLNLTFLTVRGVVGTNGSFTPGYVTNLLSEALPVHFTIQTISILYCM